MSLCALLLQTLYFHFIIIAAQKNMDNQTKKKHSLKTPIRVLHYPPYHEYVETLQSSNIVQFNSFYDSRIGYEIPEFLLDVNFLKKNALNYDLVHWHFRYHKYPTSKIKHVLAYFRDKLKKPIVWTCHDLFDITTPNTSSDKFKPEIDFEWINLFIKYSNVITTLTNWCKAELICHLKLNDNQVIVMPHGPFLVDTEKIQFEASKNDLGISEIKEDDYIFLLPNGFRYNKDLLHALVAFNEVFTNYQNVKLIILFNRIPTFYDTDVFSLNHKNLECYKIAKHSQNVFLKCFPGHIPWSKYLPFFVASNAILLPYLWGTHSGLIELAKDLHKQVIAPKIGGFNEQFPHAHFYEIYDNAYWEFPSRLAKAMLEAYDSPKKYSYDRLGERKKLISCWEHIYKTSLNN